MILLSEKTKKLFIDNYIPFLNEKVKSILNGTPLIKLYQLTLVSANLAVYVYNGLSKQLQNRLRDLIIDIINIIN